jgi:hypothetical protein
MGLVGISQLTDSFRQRERTLREINYAVAAMLSGCTAWASDSQLAWPELHVRTGA